MSRTAALRRLHAQRRASGVIERRTSEHRGTCAPTTAFQALADATLK
jgi:hypothetical protein